MLLLRLCFKAHSTWSWFIVFVMKRCTLKGRARFNRRPAEPACCWVAVYSTNKLHLPLKCWHIDQREGKELQRCLCAPLKRAKIKIQWGGEQLVHDKKWGFNKWLEKNDMRKKKVQLSPGTSVKYDNVFQMLGDCFLQLSSLIYLFIYFFS